MNLTLTTVLTSISFTGKLANDDDDILSSPNSASLPIPVVRSTATIAPLTTSTREAMEMDIHRDDISTKATEIREPEQTENKQPRLLNLNVEDLQSFANALHNETRKDEKKMPDLSDVNLDDDDEDSPRMTTDEHDPKNHPDKHISDKFYTNLQVPFHPLLSNMDKPASAEETDMCKDNGISYKVSIILSKCVLEPRYIEAIKFRCDLNSKEHVFLVLVLPITN